MNKSFGVKALIGIAIIASVLFAAPTIGRFTPSHRIVQDVYCGSCHPEQLAELSATTHMEDFAKGVNNTVVALGGDPIPAAMAITGGCTMCHNFWDNMKWFGVSNYSLSVQQIDNPAPITDIYGNTVSPYGTSSTQGYQMNMGIVIPWTAGLNVWEYTGKDTVKYDRLDYVWSNLSAISPGPAYFNTTGAGYSYNINTGKVVPIGGGYNGQTYSCGTVEKGMCHIARTAVALAELDQRPEYQNATPAQVGSGVFFRHEMAYTTAQYAAKPVKICGACHVFKLPPMTWGGEPWSAGVIQAAANSATFNTTGILPSNPNDPFGFTPNYGMVGVAGLTVDANKKDAPSNSEVITAHQSYYVAFKTPDWAHQNVPCIRCHVHAGINGETVSDNTAGTGTAVSPLVVQTPLPYPNSGGPINQP